MKPEQKFYQQIKQHLPGHVQRLESSAGSGVPDLTICHRGVEVWAELKCDLDGMILLRREQYAWGMRRSTAGGRVWVIAHIRAWRAIALWPFPLVVVPHGRSHKYVAISTVSETILYPGREDQMARYLFPSLQQ